MSDGPILVTAPTGNVGREVVRALLARGLPVRAGLHHPERADLPPEVERIRFDFDDRSSFGPAVDGARGLFLLRPTQITKVKQTLVPALQAAAAAGTQHCVFLSVDGAEKQPWLPHRKVEKALEAGTMSWTFLRPNHFMQNMLGPYRQGILAGRLALPAGDGKVSFVDCADLGEVAGMAFADPAVHAGRAYHLTGPEAIGFEQVVQEISDATGRTVAYEKISPLTYLREQRRAGAPFVYAAVLTGLHVSVRRGSAARVDPTLARLLDRPPRTVADFIADHAAQLGGAAAEPAAPAAPRQPSPRA